MANELGISQRSYSSIENESSKIDTDKLKAISAILEIGMLDILNFDDRVLFNNSNCSNSNLGMFNTINMGTEEQMSEMKEEIKHLRQQVNFLQELIQKQFGTK